MEVRIPTRIHDRTARHNIATHLLQNAEVSIDGERLIEADTAAVEILRKRFVQAGSPIFERLPSGGNGFLISVQLR